MTADHELFVEKRSILAVVAIFAVVAGAPNYGVWLMESLDLGGNALSGEVRDGHYLVGNKGRYVEVTPEQWEHSRIHTRSIFVTQPLMLIALGYLVWIAARRGRGGGSLGLSMRARRRGTDGEFP